MKKLFENWRRYVENKDIDEARIEPLVYRKRDDEASLEETGEWYDDEHETLADRKFADRPADDPTPSFQQTQDRAEQLDQVDHAAAAAAEEDAAAGIRQTEAPHSWSLVADEWLEAYNHAYDAALGAQ
jgi:Mg-chelatase subunit ChlI